MKVAMVTTWRVKCGIATYSENLVRALAKKGVDVYVVRVSRFGHKMQENFLNLVHRIPVDKIDVIHIQHEYGIYQQLEQRFYAALKNLGKPIVTTMHAVGIKLATDSGVAASSDRIIVHNKFCQSRFGYKSTIVPHGTSLHETMPAEKAKASFNLQPEAPIVGYCGFISEYKGLEVLIEAMTKVRKAGLLVAGGWHTPTLTPYMSGLRQESFELLPGRCQWTGYVEEERLPAAYGAMDIVVYPSRFATESGALLMALGYGKAVLATGIAPFKEKEKLGALMTFKGVRGLTRKIKQLLKDEDLRRTLEEGAKRYAEENSWSKVAERHIALYNKVLNTA